mmetsp:Transcript_110785/g.220359  ORF Transcript_110785/g.220359 Transcript_110785/m.220359 type:complete len:200 (-) Transcript_110785:350-949(-)
MLLTRPQRYASYNNGRRKQQQRAGQQQEQQQGGRSAAEGSDPTLCFPDELLSSILFARCIRVLRNDEQQWPRNRHADEEVNASCKHHLPALEQFHGEVLGAAYLEVAGNNTHQVATRSDDHAETKHQPFVPQGRGTPAETNERSKASHQNNAQQDCVDVRRIEHQVVILEGQLCSLECRIVRATAASQDEEVKAAVQDL